MFFFRPAFTSSFPPPQFLALPIPFPSSKAQSRVNVYLFIYNPHRLQPVLTGLMDHDAEVAEFVTMTGAPADVASDILTQCEWQLSAAVDFFFGSKPQSKPHPKTPSDEGSRGCFSEMRDLARHRQSLLLVCIVQRPLPVPFLSRPSLRNFLVSRFVPLEVALSEPEGASVAAMFKVTEVPSFFVFHPKHGVVGRGTNEEGLIPYLEQALREFPENGLRLPFEMDYGETSESSEGSEEEPEPVRTVIVQLPERRMVALRVRPEGEMRTVYKKVARRMGRKMESFVLALPTKRLKDGKAMIADAIPTGAVLRVVDR
jgi:hypothetical protein